MTGVTAPGPSPRPDAPRWRRLSTVRPRSTAVAALAAWCAVVAFVARACVPRSLDLRVYRDASRLALNGGAVYTSTFTAQHFPFTYPPFALFVFAPLTTLGLHTAIWSFDALGAAALVLATSIVLRHVIRWPRATSVVVASLLAGVACLALEPLRSTLLNGQVNLELMALVIVDVFVVPARYRGVLIGLAAAVKLTPLVFVLYLVLDGQRRAALRAGVTLLAATALAWLLAPGDSRAFWFHLAFSPGHRGAARTAYNQSWWGLVGRLPAVDDPARIAAWLVLCGATLAVGCYVAHRCLRSRRHLDALVAVAIMGLLLSPISWTHHWCWVALVPIALLAPRPRNRLVTAAMALLLAVAVVAPYGWHATGAGSVVPGFSLVGAGALLLVAMAVAERRASRAPAPAAPVVADVAR